MTRTITQTIKRTIANRRLFGSGAKVLIGCSGGPDSVALTHALARLADEIQVRVEVASVDHGLRAESADEVAQVGRLARELGLRFHALQVSVTGSLQASARASRYEALLSCAHQSGADAVAVGHTQDDQAETVLHRLVRGSGVRGLSAITPARGDGVVRPLLDVTRAEVEAYITQHALPVLRDPSNANPRFTRVRVREALLPLLKQENGQIVAHLAALADEARELRGYLDAQASAFCEGEPTRLGLSEVNSLAQPLRIAVLRRFVQRFGEPKRSHLLQLDEVVVRRNTQAQVLLPGGAIASIEDGWLVTRTEGLTRSDPPR